MTTESEVRSALASAFEDSGVRGLLREGSRHAVYEVSVEGRRAACKVTDGDPELLARERAVLAAVARERAVPVPSVLAAGDGYLVLEWVGGEAGDSDGGPERRRERLRSVGRTLARLHAATADWFEGHGDLDPGESLPGVADPKRWPARFEGFVGEWADRLAGTPDADVGVAVREFVTAHRAAFADRPPVLVHGEPAPEHVHFEGDGVAGILDWELAQAAPGEFDLVWAERDFLRPPFEGEDPTTVEAECRRALHEGYETVRPPGEGSTLRRNAYRGAFAMRSLGAVEDGETDGDTPGSELRASLRSFVFECLDDAESRDH